MSRRSDWDFMDDEDPDRFPDLDPAGWRDDFAASLRFFTRLPFPGEAPAGAPDFSRAVRAVPLVGLVVGLVIGIALAICVWIGLPALSAAATAVAVGILATGALHEDGLSDTADGLGGGWTPKTRLEIMRDSRIGAYGAIAIALSLILRISAIAGILQAGGLTAAVLLVVSAETISRTGMVWLTWQLPPARVDGAAVAVGQPRDGAARLSLALGGILAFIGAALATGILSAAFALATAGLAVFAVSVLATAKVGGQTGDIAGATQQAALIAFLLAALASLPS